MKEPKKLKRKANKNLVNIPEAKLKTRPHTRRELHKAAKARLSKINQEFADGFEFIGSYPKSVSFFGSARFKENNEHYKEAQEIARRVCSLGFTVVTGGGPGIMEAGNRGAKEACGSSIGFNIELPFEQNINPYVTHGLNFYYFFSRKVILAFSAEAYIFFPGGFGTLDEFFEIVTLIQTKKIEKVPVILVGKDYWDPLNEFIQKSIYDEHKAIDKADMKLYTITDDIDEVIRIIKKAPLRDE